MKKTTSLLVSLLIGILPAAFSARAADVDSFFLIKGQRFIQTNSGAALLDTFSDLVENRPYSFSAWVTASSRDSITAATLRKLGSVVAVTLLNSPSDLQNFEAEFDYLTKAALDGAYPSGDYRFTIVTGGGTLMVTNAILSDRYPTNAPRILNWNALQSVIVTDQTTIEWEPFLGGTTNDFVQLSIESTSGTNSTDVFFSGDPGAEGSLNGTSTSVVLPPNTLLAGSTYRANLVFAKLAPPNTTGLPGAVGRSAHFKETTFGIIGATTPPAAGRFRIANERFEAWENAEFVTISLSRAGGSSGAASVLVTTRAGTASPGTDYQETTTRVVWADGDDLNQDVVISMADDLFLEGNEVFFVTLSAPLGGADLGLPVEAAVTIMDNEVAGAGVLQFSAAMFMGVERTTNVAVTVTRTGGATGRVEVTYVTATNNEPNAAQAPEDFTLASDRLVFSNGVTTRTINIPIVADNLDENDESFTIFILNPPDGTGGAAFGARSAATVVIKDDDTAGSLAFSAARYSVPESTNATHVGVILRRTGGGADAVGVELAIRNDSTAEVDEDYTHGGGDTTNLIFAAGQMAVTNFFDILTDTESEGNETIHLELRYPFGGATLGRITNATISILDDEVTLQFTSGFYTNRENSPVALLFVERTGPLNVSASVRVATTGGGSAQPEADYLPVNSIVTFNPGQSRKPVGIRMVNDFLVEAPETVGLILQDPSANALLGPTNTTTLVINSEDAGGTIQFASATVNILESRPFVPIVVTRTGGLASNVTVRLRTAALGEGAIDGGDYAGIDTNLVFGARELVKRINIPILDDTIDEEDETFQVTLDNVEGGGAVGSRSAQTVAILDNDSAGRIGFARGETIVNEGATNAVIIVNRVGGAAGPVTVRLATANNTAIGGGVDFGSLNTVLTFAAGEMSKTNFIPIIDDAAAEGGVPEIINLTLGEFTGGAIPGLVAAVIRIVDNESSVAFTNTTATATEGRPLVVTVTRGGSLSQTGQVEFMTMDGTALAGQDYTLTNGTLVFPPNIASRSFTVRILNDLFLETNEVFTVVLKNATGVLLGQNTNMVVTLADASDANPISLTRADFFDVTAQGVTNGAFHRHFAVADAVGDGGAFNLVHFRNEGSNSYRIIGSSSIQDEQITLVASGATGPGAFVLTRQHLQADAFYALQRTDDVANNFTYGAFDEGATGLIIIDGLDSSRISGRFDIIISNMADATKWVRCTGSFKATLRTP